MGERDASPKGERAAWPWASAKPALGARRTEILFPRGTSPLDWHTQQPGALLVTSRLTVLEALVGPIKIPDTARLQRTEAALDSLLILDLDDGVVRRAAQIRATHGVRTPDALHLATATEAQADIYLTGERRLKAYKGVHRGRPSGQTRPDAAQPLKGAGSRRSARHDL